MRDSRAQSTPVHHVVGVQLRAPRVAVVFDGGSDWQFWARDAMREVTSSWAGAGFVLVPHHDGRIDPLVTQWVQAYDPDFVVAATPTWRQGESVNQGTLALGGSDHATPSPNADAARTWLARHCTPYARMEGGRWDEDRQDLTGRDHSQLPAATSVAGPAGVCRAVPGHWGGSVATAAATHVGVLNPPQPGATGTDDDAAVLAHLLQVPHTPPPAGFVYSPTGLAMSMDVTACPSALDATRHGLTWVRSSGLNRQRWWVVGPDADDFAVAMIMNRIYHDTVWIDPTWAGTEPLTAILSRAATSPLSRGVLVSVTLADADLTRWATTLQMKPPAVAVQMAPHASQARCRQQRPIRHLAVEGQHDRWHSLPLLVRSDGSIELAATPPLPAVEPGHRLDTTLVPVQVDLHVPDATMPAGRGLDAHPFAGEGDERYHTWVRSSRSGLSYQSFRFDLVSSGATHYGRLATPRLSVPGLRPWVAQMADQAGYELRDSDAGRRSNILARLWGGRDKLAAGVDSPVRDALGHFTPPKGKRHDYLEDQAVRITRDRGVITFAGLLSIWPDRSDELAVRHVIDTLTQRRILRRGLLLRCPDCLRVDFHPVEELAQDMTCVLCGARVSFVQTNWNKPEQEPRWFYDAHPVARGLVSSNSDVPLLLAAHLTKHARVHAHIGEIEFTRDAKAVAETDVVAFADGILSVAEAKTNTNLAGNGPLGKAIDKRVLVARVLRADQIILATTEAAWPDQTVSALREAIANHDDWFGRPPMIRLITGLRAGTVDRDVTL